VERLWRDVDRIAVSERLARHAGELADTQALRGYDAVHLASALAVADDDLTLVAADRDLLAAARALAITTAPLP
jgi:predicted nucleic acid-binding protein